MVQLMFLPLLEDFDAAGEYSWGSAALAWLYRELCRASRERMHDISGFLILVQIWAWYRFPHIAPHRLLRQPITDVGGMHLMFERFSLMSSVNIVIPWTGRPLHSTKLIEGLPPYCSDGADIWQAVLPWIYFFIVEMHHPDRVHRQFGFWQTIPHDCDTVTALHDLDLRRTKTKDWVKHHKEWIQLWDQCRTRIAIGEPWDGDMHDDDPYMVWYRRIIRRCISHAACTYDFMSGHLVQIFNASLEGSHIGTLARQALAALHEQDRFVRVPPPQPDVDAHAEAQPSDGVNSELYVERDFTSIPDLRSM
ncbi:hypothetical protein ACSBR2_033357 [Camellia fascicularis]